MKLTLIALAAFTGLTLAQGDGGLPSCAQNCATQQFTGGSYAGCGTDPKCICSNKTFLNTISCCLQSVCSQADIQSAITYAQQICQAQGVAVPSVVSCDSAALSSTASSTAAMSTGSGSMTMTSGATAATTTGSAMGAGTTTTGASMTSSSASKAWAPRQTAALAGAEIVGGLVAGWALM